MLRDFRQMVRHVLSSFPRVSEAGMEIFEAQLTECVDTVSLIFSANPLVGRIFDIRHTLENF